jgi:hypothetical protein
VVTLNFRAKGVGLLGLWPAFQVCWIYGLRVLARGGLNLRLTALVKLSLLESNHVAFALYCSFGLRVLNCSSIVVIGVAIYIVRFVLQSFGLSSYIFRHCWLSIFLRVATFGAVLAITTYSVYFSFILLRLIRRVGLMEFKVEVKRVRVLHQLLDLGGCLRLQVVYYNIGFERVVDHSSETLATIS